MYTNTVKNKHYVDMFFFCFFKCYKKDQTKYEYFTVYEIIEVIEKLYLKTSKLNKKHIRVHV